MLSFQFVVLFYSITCFHKWASGNVRVTNQPFNVRNSIPKEPSRIENILLITIVHTFKVEYYYILPIFGWNLFFNKSALIRISVFLNASILIAIYLISGVCFLTKTLNFASLQWFRWFWTHWLINDDQRKVYFIYDQWFTINVLYIQNVKRPRYFWNTIKIIKFLIFCEQFSLLNTFYADYRINRKK